MQATVWVGCPSEEPEVFADLPDPCAVLLAGRDNRKPAASHGEAQDFQTVLDAGGVPRRQEAGLEHVQ